MVRRFGTACHSFETELEGRQHPAFPEIVKTIEYLVSHFDQVFLTDTRDGAFGHASTSPVTFCQMSNFVEAWENKWRLAKDSLRCPMSDTIFQFPSYTCLYKRPLDFCACQECVRL